MTLEFSPLTLVYGGVKGHSHCAPYGAAKQLLSAVNRCTALHGAVRRRTALNYYAVRHAY